MSAGIAGGAVTSETHVGVVGNLSVLTPVQRSWLAYTLASIALRETGQLVLHHGCREGADEIAHRIVRLLGGWQVHGHLARADGDSSSRRGRSKHAAGDSDVRHPIKSPEEQEEDILTASTILIIVGPCRGKSIRAAKPGSVARNGAAGTPVREVFYLPSSGVQPRAPSHQADDGVRATTRAARSVGVKDVSWAALQGREDRKAGTQCGSYKGFCKRYNLTRSEKAWEMWTRYYRPSRQLPATAQRKRPSPPRQAEARPARSSALSEERLKQLQDLQRQLNPPEAIRDAWR